MHWPFPCSAAQDFEALKSQVAGKGFQVVYDINGREAEEVRACEY